MIITENKLRKIIRSIIRESYSEGDTFSRGPGGPGNNPLAANVSAETKVKRQKAKEHYAKYGCKKVPDDSSIEYFWAEICRENGEDPYNSNEIDWDL